VQTSPSLAVIASVAVSVSFMTEEQKQITAMDVPTIGGNATTGVRNIDRLGRKPHEISPQ